MKFGVGGLSVVLLVLLMVSSIDSAEAARPKFMEFSGEDDPLIRFFFPMYYSAEYPEDLVERQQAMKRDLRGIAADHIGVRDIRHGTEELTLKGYLEKEDLSVDEFHTMIEQMDWRRCWVNTVDEEFIVVVHLYDLSDWRSGRVAAEAISSPAEEVLRESEGTATAQECIEDVEVSEYLDIGKQFVDDERYGERLSLEEYLALEGIKETKLRSYVPHCYMVERPPKESGLPPILVTVIYRSRCTYTPLYPGDGHCYSSLTCIDGQ